MKKSFQRLSPPAIAAVSFLLPALVLLAVYAGFGMAPFGGKSLLIMDMSDQYVEFYAGLRHLGQNGDLLFSWSKAMGGNYVGVFAYYLSSPFSFLVLLFPESQITTALLVINLLKVGCAGLSFALFLRARFGCWKWIEAFFALAYALMSYVVVYSMCLMWLDGVLWLPIVLIGVERVLRGKRPWLLLAALAVLFVSNYYTAYMVVLFAVLYFLLRYFGEENRPVRQFLKPFASCAGSVAAAGGLGAWLLVPTLFSLMQGKIGGSANAVQSVNFDLSQLPGKFLPGVFDDITNSGLPSVFCGCAALLLVFCFFLHPGFSKRERLFSGGLLLLLCACFWIGPLDVMWHGFQPPNWFPYRYAFVFGALTVYLAARAFFSLREMPRKRFGAAVLFCILFYLSAYLLWKNKDWKPLAMALAAVAAYGALLCCQRTAGGGRRLLTGVAAVLFLCCGAAEMALNGSSMVQGLDRRFGYRSDASYTSFQEKLLPLVRQAQTEAGGAFFRMEKDFERSKNDAIGLGYNGITHYSSAYSRSVNEFLKSLGMSQAYFWNSYYGATPLTDSLFSVRYLMLQGEACDWYRTAGKSGDVTLVENPDALSLAVAVPGEVRQPVFTEDPFENQEALLKSVVTYEGSCWSAAEDVTVETEHARMNTSGGKTVFEKEGSPAKIVYRFRTAAAGPVYAYFSSQQANSCKVSVNGADKGSYFTNETRMNLYAGTFSKGETVEIAFTMNQTSLTIGAVSIQTLKEDVFREQMGRLQDRQMTVGSYSARTISGTVTAAESGYLYTSIPFDPGWSAKIDGEAVQAFELAGALLAVPLQAGTHTVELFYEPPGFRAGVVITGLSAAAVLTIGIVLLYRKKKKHNEKGL